MLYIGGVKIQMVTIIGYSAYGSEFFKSPSPPVRKINKVVLKGSIVDELMVRQSTDGFDESREEWSVPTRLLAKFVGDLEGGNIQNDGLVIERFSIRRRRASELDSIVVGYRDFVNDTQISFTDYSQPNDKLIYSISPMSNDLEGEPHEAEAESDFTGWWLVDVDDNSVLGFDKFLDGEPDVETSITQGRTVIETLSKFPQVYYDEMEYHSFSLSTVIIPSEFERSGRKFEDVLNLFTRKHKAFVVKSSDGRLFVCDVSNPRFSTPLNTWKQRDYGTLTLDFVEVQDYKEYMQEHATYD